MAKSGWLWVAAALVAIAAAIATNLHTPVQPRARLAADQGTIAAMRSAVAIYYGQHSQTFPEHPGNYVNPSPPDFQCANFVYAYSSITGEIRILSANTVTDCP